MFSGKYLLAIPILLISWLIFGPAPLMTAGETRDVAKISVEHVKQLLGKPDTVIIDVRKPRNWWRTSKKIVTAVREDPSKVDRWAQKYAKGQTLIFYCT